MVAAPAPLGILNCQHDEHLIPALDADCGLDKLTEDARKKAIENGTSEEDSRRIYYSLIKDMYCDRDAEACEITRNFLESTGALAKLIETWKLKAFGPRNPDDWMLDDPRYTLCIIGMAAMSNGCTLDEDFLRIMRHIFTECGFMRDSLKQIDTALNGPDGFKNDGTPYDIFQMGRHPPNPVPDDVVLYPNRPGSGMFLMNMADPFSFYSGPDNAALIEDIKTGMERAQQGRGKCGQCGSTQAGLVKCGRCKARRYCNAECQKKHWKTHKLVCGTGATSA